MKRNMNNIARERDEFIYLDMYLYTYILYFFAALIYSCWLADIQYQ